jgi:hypothetical protein
MTNTLPLLTALLLAPLAALNAAEPQSVSTSATSAADFSYAPPSLGTGKLPPSLPKSTISVTVNRGGLDPDFGAFCTLPNIVEFHGRLFVTWNNHLRDEDHPGMRIQMRHSSDGGKTWLPELSQPPVNLSPSLGEMREMSESDWTRLTGGTRAPQPAVAAPGSAAARNAKGTKVKPSKSAQWNSGFAFTSNRERLWAIANEGTSLAKGRGLLALELKRDATRGEVLWLEPEPVTLDEGYPVYLAMNDPAAAVIGKSIRDVIDDRTALHAVSYDTKRRAGDEVNPATIRFPNLPGSAADGQRLIEPSPAYRLKDGTLVRFWRNYGDDTHKHYIWRLYVSLSHDNGTTWSAPERTAIPSNSTRQSTGTLPDGRVFLIHNPYTYGDDFWKGEDAALLATASPAEKLGGARKVLTLSLSDDGIHFNQSWTIRVLETPPRIEGWAKRHFDVGNPAATVVGGDLCIVYSLNKEDIELCKIRLADLAR